jgi:alkaline phosphatase
VNLPKSLTIILVLFGFIWKKTPSDTQVSQANSPKNIILVIGDGMGLSQISAALYNSNNRLSLESFPVIGFQKTYSTNNLVTDSAAAGTAIATGKKTKNNTLGLDENGNRCESILEEAEKNGLATGLVVTSSIQHATPASFYAHQPARNLYEDITLDLLDAGIDLFIGGGKQHFERREKDERNLTEELKANGVAIYDYFNNDLNSLVPDTLKRFAFFTADKEPLSALTGRDFLPKAAELATKFLSHRSPNGFFLMVEGSQIDWACHSNKTEALYAEMADLDLTIKELIDFARKDGETLVIVTADHETGGLGLNSGTPRLLDLQYTTNGHTATMVPVFAFGPKAELFRGIYENTEIHHKMQQAFGFSEN